MVGDPSSDSMPNRAAAIMLVSAILLAACSRDRREESPRAAPIEPTLSAGDVRIQTTTGQLDLALIGDTISAGLAGDVLAKARHAIDSASVSNDGVGSSIGRMVLDKVGSAVTSRVRFPVSAVKDVRHENGAIVFEWNERPTRLFEQTKVNGKPFLESFSPADAERFVRAVRARMAAAR